MGLTRQTLPNLHRVDYQQRAQLVPLMAGQDCLVHLAGVAHNPKATTKDYHAGNVELTTTLVKAAKDSGIRHIVMMSSVKAMGEETPPEHPFHYQSDCNPEDDYGRSKLMAERTLTKLCDQLNIRWTIIRPPLVYAPNADGNIAKLRNAIKKGWPLPVKHIANKRDIVSLSVLCSLVIHCIGNSDAHDKVFLVSDGKALTTADLVTLLAKDLDLQPKIIALPLPIAQTLKTLPFTKGIARKLAGNLELDINHTIDVLGWLPEHAEPIA